MAVVCDSGQVTVTLRAYETRAVPNSSSHYASRRLPFPRALQTPDLLSAQARGCEVVLVGVGCAPARGPSAARRRSHLQIFEADLDYSLRAGGFVILR